MLIVGYLSDWLNVKGYLIIACLTMAAIGFIVLISTYGKVSGTAGTCLVVMGVYPAAVLQLTWVCVLPLPFYRARIGLSWNYN